MRDVTFDTTTRYKDDPERDEITLTEQEADALMVPQLEVDQALDDWEPIEPFEPFESTQTHPSQETPSPSNRPQGAQNREKSVEIDSPTVAQLLTPRETPAPAQIDQSGSVVGRIAEEVRNTGQQLVEQSSDVTDVTHTRESTTRESTIQPTTQQPQQEQDQWLNLRGPAGRNIDGNISSANQIEGKRVRKQSAKAREAKQSQFTLNLDNLGLNSFFYDAFITAIESHGLSRTRNRIHKSELPPPLRN